MPAEVGDTRAAATSGRVFRGDVDGLRAVAILLVVGFHSGVGGFDGGFVGVDVFFVLSGYLITRNLLAETARTGRVRLWEFWARRIRRLVPALAVMLVVVLGLAMLVLSPLEWRSAAEQARAAALYVSNFFFAAQPSGYFAAGIDQSLFLHTWSLGVEEQFYLIWPLAFGAACVVAARRTARIRRTLVVAFVVVLAASLTWSIVLTGRGSTWAFFGLPTRAWEFAAAGLLAALPLPALARRREIQIAAAIAGLALIGWATLTLSGSTPYPGYRALAPVTGTMLLIAAGGHTGTDNAVNRTLARPPAQWLGRVSYSWYLWHWPLILLAVAWAGRDTVPTRLVAAAVALAAAAVAHHYVENPLRFGPTFALSRPRTYALGAGLTLAVVLTTAGVLTTSTRRITGNDLLTQIDTARRQLGKAECSVRRTTPDGIEYCEDGDPDADRTVLLVGDSHAGHWVEAFAEAARAEHTRLVAQWHPGCPAIPVDTQPFADLEEGDCDRYRAANANLIDDLAPDAVVVSNSSGYSFLIRDAAGAQVTGAPRQAEVWANAYRTFVDDLRERGIALAAVLDNPGHARDPVDCVAQAGRGEPCASPLEDSLDRIAPIRDAERQVLESRGQIPVLDVTDDLCDDTTCAVMLDGILAYADRGHLTAAFTRMYVPEIRALLRDLVSAPS